LRFGIKNLDCNVKKLLIVLILFFSYASYSQSVEKFVKKGMEKLEKLDFKGAIKDYTKAIELAAPNYVQPNIIDYQEKDYYEYAAAYYNRGRAKRSLEDYKGAIADYTKAIELTPEFVMAYNNRGNTKADLEDYEGAIADYTKAIELTSKVENQNVLLKNRGNTKTDLEDYEGAIADYTKAIELDSDDANAYFYRGDAKEMLGDFNGACEDWKIAVSLGNEEAKKWVANQCN